jgi:hypothetical protein
VQYVLAADAGSAPTEDTIFRLPADYALKQADVFRKWAEVYAKDTDAFTRDFQRTYQRAMQVGCTLCLQWINGATADRRLPTPKACMALQHNPLFVCIVAVCSCMWSQWLALYKAPPEVLPCRQHWLFE